MWTRNDSLPMDIWIKGDQMDMYRDFICYGDFIERCLLLGEDANDEKAKNEYIKKYRNEISKDRILDFAAAGFGNVIERSVSILIDDKVTETWQRTK